MDKPRPPAVKRCLLALAFLGLFTAGGTADAVLYVYEKPDGSSLVTDHAVNDKRWRLVAVRGEVRRAARLMATENSPRFREGPSTYDRPIKNIAHEYGVSFDLVKTIMNAESPFNPYVIPNKNAVGLMQMLSETAKYSGVHDIEARRADRLMATENSPLFRAGPSTYDRLIKDIAHEYGVNFALVKAIMHAESYFNPHATSNKGAVGLMQVLPETAKDYGVHDIYDPVENIRVAVRHLRYLSEAFDNDYYLVIAAYNAGEHAVKKYRGMPPYAETQNYVQKVLHYTHEYGSRS